MSSEILGGAENTLKGNLGGAWDIKHGYADAYTDLGIARMQLLTHCETLVQ
jgi:hypothetical protein